MILSKLFKVTHPVSARAGIRPDLARDGLVAGSDLISV